MSRRLSPDQPKLRPPVLHLTCDLLLCQTRPLVSNFKCNCVTTYLTLSIAVFETGFAFGSSSSSDGSFRTAHNDTVISPGKPPLPAPLRVPETIRMPEPVLYTPSLNSSASSIFASDGSSLSDILEDVIPEYDGYDSPPPADDRLAEIRNERRYRLLLTHEFHPSREFLWFYFLLID